MGAFLGSVSLRIIRTNRNGILGHWCLAVAFSSKSRATFLKESDSLLHFCLLVWIHTPHPLRIIPLVDRHPQGSICHMILFLQVACDSPQKRKKQLKPSSLDHLDTSGLLYCWLESHIQYQDWSSLCSTYSVKSIGSFCKLHYWSFTRSELWCTNEPHFSQKVMWNYAFLTLPAPVSSLLRDASKKA